MMLSWPTSRLSLGLRTGARAALASGLPGRMRVHVASRSVVHLAQVAYTATGCASGLGRAGRVAVPEAGLALQSGVPGRPASGVNPEQLMAAGWSACFFSSLQLGAKRAGARVPPDLAIEVDVHLGKPDTPKLFGLSADIYAITRDEDTQGVAELLRLAEDICPYSQSLKGNIVVTLHPEGRRKHPL